MRRFLVITFGLTTLLSMSACTTPNLYQNASSTVNTTQNQIKDDSQPAPSVLVKTGAYVNLKPVSLEHPPQWMSQTVNIDGRLLPFASYVQVILAGTPAVPVFDDPALSRNLVTLRYQGTISGALDALAAKTDSAYQLEGSTVHFSQLETKTFDVSFLPGETSYLVGHAAGASMMGGSSGSSGGGSSSGGGNGSTIQTGMGTSDDQYSKLSGSLSIWTDMSKTLNAMKSKKGVVDVDEATTSVTVTDYPNNIREMSKYLAKLNKELSRQVLIQVEVLQVDLSQNFNYGVDWKYLQGNLKTLGNTVPLTFTPLGNAATNVIGWAHGNNQILLNALAQQGNVSVVTSPRVMTLNNQLAEIDITNQTSYLASVETTVTSGSGATGFSQTSYNPGVVNTGFVLYVLPKIEKDKVYLQLSAIMSTLKSIDTFPQGATATQTQVQLPNVDYKRFNQRSAVPNGDTLILAGYRQANDTANTTGLFGITPLGGKGASQENIEMIILITPTVVGESNQ